MSSTSNIKNKSSININKSSTNINNTTRVSKEQAEKAIELIQYNKINAKNSFDINVGFIEDIAKLLNNKEESSWQKASASLDASAKIYGYRVDSVHSETFKFLGGLNRNEKKDKENEDENEEKKKEKKIHNNNNGVNTIEENHEKLNLTKYDLEVDVDPLFKAMTAKFNESGARGLLLNTLPLDGNLDILLESKKCENNNNNLNNNNNNNNNNLNNNNNNNENNNNNNNNNDINNNNDNNINNNNDNNNDNNINYKYSNLYKNQIKKINNISENINNIKLNNSNNIKSSSYNTSSNKIDNNNINININKKKD